MFFAQFAFATPRAEKNKGRAQLSMSFMLLQLGIRNQRVNTAGHGVFQDITSHLLAEGTEEKKDGMNASHIKTFIKIGFPSSEPSMTYGYSNLSL